MAPATTAGLVPQPEPIAEALEDHLEEAQRQQDHLADLLRADPAERPEGWPLRGEILAHVDRLRAELQPGHLPEQAQVKAPLRAVVRDRRREPDKAAPRGRANRAAWCGRARRTAARECPRWPPGSVRGQGRPGQGRPGQDQAEIVSDRPGALAAAPLAAGRPLVGPAQHGIGAFQVVPVALGPPGRARLRQRPR